MHLTLNYLNRLIPQGTGRIEGDQIIITQKKEIYSIPLEAYNQWVASGLILVKEEIINLKLNI